MKREDVERRVEAMRAEAAQSRPDNEKLHQDEDRLHHDVLSAIATGNASDPAGCAAAALATLEINYERWYA